MQPSERPAPADRPDHPDRPDRSAADRDRGLRARAEDWLAGEIDGHDAATVRGWLQAGDTTALEQAFGARLEFGTAGIRGRLGPGPAQMNRALVVRVTAGVAARLARDAPGGLVVVGRDARHGSKTFAADAAGVLAGAGFEAMLFDRHVPTPMLAFATRYLDAAAGVQITASHNPPQDNGYKLYWSGGAQISAPLDAEISAEIDALGPARAVRREPAAVRRLTWDALVDAYTAEALAHLRFAERDLRIVTTALHGVAGRSLIELLHAAGFTDVHPVAEQQEPDPDFPTVAFPNPEEPGALDHALVLAAEVEADVILANDPDGDRIAVAVPSEGSPGGWRVLSGDEVGCILGEHLLATAEVAHPAVATTVVSSQLLGRIAEHHGAAYAETLTGFKWLAGAAVGAEARGQQMVLAYEQALGVMVGTAVLDKDGLSAALVVADLAAHLRARGGTLLDALDDLARRHGVHATGQRSVRLDPDDAPLVDAVLEGLRTHPPEDVAGVAVTALADHQARVRHTAHGAEQPLDLPSTPLAVMSLADGTRLQVRPSGTEPLLKFYAEVVEPPTPDLAASRAAAAVRLDRMLEAFLATAMGFAERP